MHLVYTLRTGGMERNVVKVTNALNPARIQGSVCSCTQADGLKRELLPRVTLIELNRRPGTDVRFIGALTRVLREHRPDILHTHSWGTLCEGLVSARLAGVPIVIHGEHGTLQLRAAQRVVQRFGWGCVAQVTAVSRELAVRMHEATGFPIDRILVIPNGLDLHSFDTADRNEMRAALGLTPDDVVVGTAGRLVPVKNVPMFLAAFAQARRQLGTLRGLVVGDGPLRNELKELALALGLQDAVRFLGHRDDMAAVMRALDVFVLSSDSEGLSNTIMEAMAGRVAVVATDVGGNAELVEAGVTGLLVPPKDADSLGRAIVRVSEEPDLRQRMADAGRSRVQAEFGLTRMIQRYEELYTRTAGWSANGAVQGRMVDPGRRH